jgi:hypothetical protein
MTSAAGPVLILGAGATKACNGPLTNEILFEADKAVSSIEREGYLASLDRFLEDVFRLPPRPSRKMSSYPGLPLLMSLVDAAIDRAQPLHANYDVAKLRDIRSALDYAIFAVLDYKLRGTLPPHHGRAMDLLFPNGTEARVISLNYDIIADNVLANRSQSAFPDYGCDIRTELYRTYPKQGKLLKLHGSLNWLYCPNCHRLDVAVSRSGRSFSKALEELFIAEGGEANDLDHRYSCHGSECKTCKTFVRPVMITPTQKKDYRNPHITQVWYHAEELLRSATSAVFVGYSMPADDVEVVYLFKRGLQHLPASEITVIEFDPTHRSIEVHEVGQRYQSVFGSGIQWHTCGFGKWLDEKTRGAQICVAASTN